MVLIVGGEGSGKRSFAQTLGFAPEEMAAFWMNGRSFFMWRKWFLRM